MFIAQPSEFNQYECPIPKPSGKVDGYLKMYNSAKTMLGVGVKSQSSKKSKAPEPTIFDSIDQNMNQLSVLFSAFDPKYEGGDFCAGLTVGFEGRVLASNLLFNGMKNSLGAEVKT